MVTESEPERYGGNRRHVNGQQKRMSSSSTAAFLHHDPSHYGRPTIQPTSSAMAAAAFQSWKQPVPQMQCERPSPTQEEREVDAYEVDYAI